MNDDRIHKGQEQGSVRLAEPIAANVNAVGNNVAALLKGGRASEVAGYHLDDPERACANLNKALELVRTRMGHIFHDIDLERIHFKVFSGNIVGESTEEGIDIHPKMLLHPAIRIAHVIAHELAHGGKDVEREDLVERAVQIFFGDSDLKHVCDDKMGKLEELAAKFDEDGDVDRGIEAIHALYYRQDFDGLYAQYHKNAIAPLKDDGARDEAYALYRDVFFELDYNEAGQEEMIRIPEPISADEAVDIHRVRKHVDERFANVEGRDGEGDDEERGDMAA